MGPQLELAIKTIGALVVILALTTTCGRLARFVGQPAVVGEMVAGVLLGPSMLGALAPAAMEHLFPGDVKGLLYVLAVLGLTLYMFLTGATIDHSFLQRQSLHKAAVLAASGVIPAFVLGAAAALIFYPQLSSPAVSPVQFTLFVAGALSITAFPMLARILEERGMANTRLGSLTLVAAAVDDAVAWGLLAVIIAMGPAGDLSGAAGAILGGAAFAVVMLTLGRRVLRPLGRRVEREGTLTREAMAVILLVVLLAGWVTDVIGIHSIFGGFVTGLTMPNSPTLRKELRTRLMDLNVTLLLPVFFAFSGLNTRLGGLQGRLLLPFFAIVVAAFVGKYAGCAITARSQGLPWTHASAIGGLMNARGLMILVFINIGLAYGMISPPVFSMLVLVAVLSTAAAMPIYRLSLPSTLEQAEKHGAVDGLRSPGKGDEPELSASLPATDG